MTQQTEGYAISNGPSKLDLMLSLFDTGMGVRIVRFHTSELVCSHDSYVLAVMIISIKRQDLHATLWDIEGIVEDPRDYHNERVLVYIDYDSNIRQGCMRFREKLATQDIVQTSDNAQKAQALMIIIQKMIATYQNSHHHDDLDDEIFRLFEKAKVIKFAEDSKSLKKAIMSI